METPNSADLGRPYWKVGYTRGEDTMTVPQVPPHMPKSRRAYTHHGDFVKVPTPVGTPPAWGCSRQDDLRAHDVDGDGCWCGPRQDLHCGHVLVHHAADRRG
jgi:hypothetical protein